MLRIRTTTPGCAKSEVVLGKADKLVKEFVYRAAIARCLPESAARDLGGKIFTFGSHLYKPSTSLSDIAPQLPPIHIGSSMPPPAPLPDLHAKPAKQPSSSPTPAPASTAIDPPPTISLTAVDPELSLDLNDDAADMPSAGGSTAGSASASILSLPRRNKLLPSSLKVVRPRLLTPSGSGSVRSWASFEYLEPLNWDNALGSYSKATKKRFLAWADPTVLPNGTRLEKNGYEALAHLWAETWQLATGLAKAPAVVGKPLLPSAAESNGNSAAQSSGSAGAQATGAIDAKEGDEGADGQAQQAIMGDVDFDLPLLADDLLKDRARIFAEFLDNESGPTNYRDAVRRMLQLDGRRLIINIDELRSYHREFATGLLEEPNGHLPAFDAALHQLVEQIHNPTKDVIAKKKKNSSISG
ncbi:hypothetical protein A4X06_0g2944 [Tilletia controversa]|uniref:Uncharacterized protein n=1 Tax=Tilletia controversa TaxID=13291 RepID=A0A8X7MWR8_9BASI|nr:hypothetical protein A4X06_0g2944 [Tilletia controversa]